MPETLITIAINAALLAPASISMGVYNFVLGALYLTASLGLSVLSSLIFKPDVPKPDDVQTQTRQNVAPRYKHYGRVKVSGNWAFAESKQGAFHKVLAIGQGPIDAIEEFWIDDYNVTPDPTTGRCMTGTSYGGATRNYNNTARIRYYLGGSTGSNYTELRDAFPTWTVDHKGKGVASLYMTQFPVKDKYFSKIFPNGIMTNCRAVIRGSLVENPVSSVTAYSDNAAAIIRDYIYNSEGLRLPKSILTKPIADEMWKTAFNKCAASYNLKTGGTEPRYRIWGSYSFEERSADVLNRMLVACDGRLMITPDGGLGLNIGDIPADPLVVDETMITGFSEVGRGRDIMATANTIRATFMYPASDYQTADADPWVDEADVDSRGEIATSYEFLMVPSHSQCRRLMKLAAARTNPSWVGTFNCNIKAMKVFGERYIRISYPPFGIDEIFEVNDFRFEIGEKNIIKGVIIQVQSMPANAYNWDAETEEGVAPVSDTSDGTSVIPVPPTLDATVIRKSIGGQLYPFVRLSFDTPPDGLTVEARGKLLTDTNWTAINVAEDATTADSFLLDDGEDYEFQIRYVSITPGDWTTSLNVTAIADTTAPAIVKAVVVTGGAGKVDMSWQSPNSSNFAATNIYRNTSNSFSGSTLITTEYGAANFPFLYTDQPLTAGTYYYWLKARNWSGVESAAVASGAITVT